MLLLGWFVTALQQPFDHPRVYVVHLVPSADSESDRPLDLPPVPFRSRNLEEFDVLRPALAETIVENGLPRLPVSSGRGGGNLEERLRALGTEDSDVLVVHVSAHGVSYDGRAYVTWGNFPTGDPASSILVGELLQAVASQNARTKLVLFDVGHVTSAPELGMLVNQFPRLVERELRALNDDSLWTFVSNATYQHSSFSPSARRSRFTEFVVRGLSGEADESGDAIVDLDELEQYVIREVGSRVDNSTGGAARQTPMLLRSGNGTSNDGRTPTLISVATLQSPQAAGSQSNDSKSTGGSANETRTESDANTGGTTSDGSASGGDAPRESGSSSEEAPPATATSGNPTAGGPAASTTRKTEGGAGQDSKKDTPKRGDASPGSAASTDGPTGTDAGPATAKSRRPQPLPMIASTADLRRAVDEAFRLRDALLDWSSSSLTPFEIAPHAWRRLELELLRLEQQSHFAEFHTTQGDAARRLITTLRRLRNGDAETRVGVGPGRFPRQPLVKVDDPTTLGMLELFAPPTTAATTPKPVPVAYDDLLDSTSPAEFRAGLGRLPSTADRFSEVRLARQLSGLTLDWSTLRRILRVQRFGERIAAASTWGHEWIAGDVALADVRLDEVVRLLTTEPWRIESGDVERLLDEANDAYERAGRTLAVLTRAKRAQARGAYVLPQLVEYCYENLEAEAEAGDDLDAIITVLEELDELTSTPRSGNGERIDTKTVELLALLERVGSTLDGDDFVPRDDDANTPPVVPGDVHRALHILAIPYAAASHRRAAWRDALNADERLERLLGRVPAIRHSPSEPPASRRRRAQFARRAAAEVRIARLTTPASDDRRNQLDAAAKSIVRRNPTSGDVELDWESTEVFGRLLRNYERAQSTRIGAIVAGGDPAPRTDGMVRIDELRRAWLGSALMDARLEGGADQWTITTRLAVAETYEFLDWQRQRLVARLVDAPGSQRRSLGDDLQRISRLAVALPGRRTFPPVAGPIFSVEGTSVVELVSSNEASITVRLRNGGGDPQPVWLLLDFDTGLLKVAPRADLAISSVEHLPDRGLRWDEAGRGLPRAPGSRPAFVLEPGETREIVFDVKRVGTAITSTNVVFRALTKTHLARHDVAVAIPRPATTAVEFTGPFAARSIAGGSELRAFPNRETAYAVGLRNLTDSDETIRVEIHAPGTAARLPAYAMSKRQAAEVVADLQSQLLGTADKVQLGTGDTTPIVLAAPSTAGSAAAASRATSAGPSTAPQAPAAPADPLPHGLVVVVETDSGWVSFHPISVAVLHPRAYVRAAADFDAKLRRLHVELAVDDDRFLPPKGLPVRGTTNPPPTNPSQQHLAATIDRVGGKADLYLNLPENLDGVVELGIDVGGYPRAFRFRLGSELASGPVAVDVTRPGARLNVPADGTAVAPTGRAIDVGLSADLPSSRDRTARFVEVGFDTNRDRRFGPNEVTTRFSIDRGVRMFWGGLGTNGLLQLKTSVTDLAASLPPPAVANGRVNLLVRTVGGGREAWSVPHEIVYDGTPPVVSKAEVGPSAAVAPGTPLTVSAIADDGALSGVASVRVGFDDGSGRFTKKPPAVAARIGEAGRWQATVPTTGLAVGPYRLLIEATDRAGNVSQPLTTNVQVATKEQLLQIVKAKAITIGGRISYGGDPVPDVAVSLTPEKGEPLPTVMTDEEGRFQIPKVPPGDYELHAKGVSRNKIRTLKQTLTVPADGSALPDLDLQLPR